MTEKKSWRCTLDDGRGNPDRRVAMMKPTTLLAVATLLALAACNNSSQPTDGNGVDANAAANATAHAAPVVLPPAIRAEATLRCKDNSLAHFVFFEGDTKLRVRSPQGADAVELTAPKAGDAYTADGGWSVKGDEKSVTLTQPGKSEQTCKA